MFTKEDMFELSKTSNIVRLWCNLVSEAKCPGCSHKVAWFKELPGDTTTKFEDRFNPGFLFHLYDTHGLSPEMVVKAIYNSLKESYYEPPLHQSVM